MVRVNVAIALGSATLTVVNVTSGSLFVDGKTTVTENIHAPLFVYSGSTWWRCCAGVLELLCCAAVQAHAVLQRYNVNGRTRAAVLLRCSCCAVLQHAVLRMLCCCAAVLPCCCAAVLLLYDALFFCS